MTVIAIERELLARARVGLGEAAGGLDDLGQGAPVDGDHGDAAMLIPLVLGAHLEAASMLVGEAEWVATAVGLSLQDAEITDSEQALDFFRLDAG